MAPFAQRQSGSPAIMFFADSALEQVPPEVVYSAAVLPRFADGRVDYSTSSAAPVLDCYVYCADKLLVLKRSNPLGEFENQWHVVSGFLDEERPLRELAIAELFEEIGPQEIELMEALPPWCSRDARFWTVYPVAARIAGSSEIRLNEEHSEFAWIPFEDAGLYLLPHIYAVWSLARRR